MRYANAVGSRFSGFSASLVRRGPSVDLDEVAVGVLEPQLVERRATPRRARRLAHRQPGGRRELVGPNDRGLASDGNTEVVERVSVRLLGVGDDEHGVRVQLRPNEGRVAMCPLLRLGAEEPSVEARALRGSFTRTLAWNSCACGPSGRSSSASSTSRSRQDLVRAVRNRVSISSRGIVGSLLAGSWMGQCEPARLAEEDRAYLLGAERDDRVHGRRRRSRLHRLRVCAS